MAEEAEGEVGGVTGAKEYTVSVEGPGLQMTREVDQGSALQVIAVLLGGGPVGNPGLGTRGRTVSATAPAAGGAGGSHLPALTVGEFLEELEPSNNPERIAGILLYLKAHHDLKVVSKEELPEWFKRAGEPAPKNLSRDLRNAVKGNLISEDPGEDGHYFVTSTGEKKLRNSAS